MKSSLNNLASIDDSIKSMHEFIWGCGKEPVKPDAHGGKAYTSGKLGDLGEQYAKCLFREAGITKLLKGEKPSPDYKILVNGEEFILEVKTVSNLYKPLSQLLREIVEGQNNPTFSKEVEFLRKNYDFRVTPFEVHREEEREFKEKLAERIKAMKLPLGKTEIVIECKVKSYRLSIQPADYKVKGFHFVEGWEPDETKALNNVIKKKRKQIGSSDILLIILLNRNIEQDDLLDFFYGQKEIDLGLQSIQETRAHSQNPIPRISQYQYERTIWGRKFKDEEGKVHTIDERLKCVIIIRPYLRRSLFFTSIKHFENFSASEYAYLRVFLEAKEFKCRWATHEANLLTC